MQNLCKLTQFITWNPHMKEKKHIMTASITMTHVCLNIGAIDIQLQPDSPKQSIVFHIIIFQWLIVKSMRKCHAALANGLQVIFNVFMRILVQRVKSFDIFECAYGIVYRVSVNIVSKYLTVLLSGWNWNEIRFLDDIRSITGKHQTDGWRKCFSRP